MRILFVCENYLPHYGGAEVVFKNLAERYVKLGHKVSLVTHQLKDTKRFEVINGVNVYRVPSLYSRYVFSFAAIFTVVKLARRHDIIQTTTFNGAVPAWIAARFTGKRVVLTVHEVWVGKWGEVTNFSFVKSFFHDFLERTIYLLPFDRYVCVSNATRKDLLRVGVRKRKALTIYNGVDYEFWDRKKFADEKGREIRKRLGLEKKFIYFSWGRPGESKGFEYAIRAAALVKKEVPNSVFLLMLGSADKYKEKYGQLLGLIDRLGLSDYVKVVESVPYDELGYYIKLADCAVVPSIAEGFGYTTAESVAMGTPVVASDAGSLPEVVSGKFLQFRSRDVKDLAARVVMVSKGKFEKSAVRKFLWRDIVKRYLDVYERLIERR